MKGTIKTCATKMLRITTFECFKKSADPYPKCLSGVPDWGKFCKPQRTVIYIFGAYRHLQILAIALDRRRTSSVHMALFLHSCHSQRKFCTVEMLTPSRHTIRTALQ